MSGQLQLHDEDSIVRCYLCRNDAAGPCMRCRRSVCGDCCVIVEGKAQKWAVCLRCEKNEGTALSGWASLALFFGKIVLTLIALILLLAWWAGDLG